MSVSNRIIFGFAAITTLLVVLGLYALGQVAEVRSTVDRIVERDLAALTQLDSVSAAEAATSELRGQAVLRFAMGTAAADGDGGFAAQTVAMQAAINRLRQLVGTYQQSAANVSRQAQWAQMVRLSDEVEVRFAAVRDASTAQLAAVRRGDRAAVVALQPTIAREQTAMIRSLSAMRGVLADTIVVGRGVARDTYERSRLSILAGLMVAILASVVIAWGIRRSIVQPLDEFMGFVARVGEGDLSGQTAATGPHEFGRLGATLNTMVTGLQAIARQSREATENLNAAATEIRASTQQQAASVEEQLAAVQETAATVDEIVHSGTQISRRAQEVIAVAQATVQTSDTGTAAVEDTVRAMDEIREQAEAVASNIVLLSEKTAAIGDIIATVNDVSERSHLLALNASIEAAAAGEAGRSFAVVASEMKTLADQAKDATRNVRSILGEIQRGINASVMLTEEAVKRAASGKARTDAGQAAIEELGARIQDSVQTFQQIVASTNQQQIGMEQVTIALQNIRQASQQTASSTRQLDQAAGDLTMLSRTLVGLTERYRL
ncbi:methyl-accepting chemotaxis protein [Sphingomonas arantia]|uniref:Methyl-accepting chemotaxis protein n=1 Tax=Sphingomonas arantia TaxID=1460676 RepID=A0ABW4U3L3_9SPHN